MKKKNGKKCLSEGGKVSRLGLDNRTAGERFSALVHRPLSGKGHQTRSANDSPAVMRRNKTEKPRS